MAAKISTIGRRLLNIKGILLNDITTCSRSVSFTSSKVDRYLSSTHTFTFIPPSSVNFQCTSISKINVLNMTTTKPQILDRPIPLTICRIDLPMIKTNISYEDIKPVSEIQDPKPSSQEEKHAVRMIVIRRRKMRIHKLKKLRKRMKFITEKVIQRRVAEKEKAFQVELMAKINDAKSFDPATYAKQKIDKANEVLTPKLWGGKRLPEFIIKDLIELKAKKKKAIEEKIERRRNMNVNASDYK